jgi:hypothetical protein
MGIEAMFKDYKTGGYNLESAKANEIRLNNLILLIAISYTISSFQVQKVKNKGVQEYISRTNEKGRKERRHNGTMYSGNILKIIIFGTTYSGTA